MMNPKLSSSLLLLLLSSLCHNGLSLQMQMPTAAAFVTSSRSFNPTALKATEQDSKAEVDSDEPKKTDSGLPELKGDFDWDAKFAGDDDWITEDVPGKIVLDEVTLAKQVTALDKLESSWRKERLQREYDESKKVGFVSEAELLNGRFAMFFLVTGLLTELWTGISIPGQVEEMLRIGGVIGFDG